MRRLDCSSVAVMAGKDAAKPAISQRLGDELAMMKTELLALHIARDPHFALGLGTFVMIEAAVRPMDSIGTPSDLRAPTPAAQANGFASDTAAAAMGRAQTGARSQLDTGRDDRGPL